MLKITAISVCSIHVIVLNVSTKRTEWIVRDGYKLVEFYKYVIVESN